MVDRKPKLIAAGAVLTIGLGLAMLFRRTEPQAVLPPPAEPSLAAALTPFAAMPAITPTPPIAVTPTVTAAPLDGQLSPLPPTPATNVGLTIGAGAPELHIPLTPGAPGPVGIAPLSVAPPLGTMALPTTPALNATGGRPVYATLGIADAPLDEPAASGYQTHVVHQGDSLERLAERYLADAGRSLELFDLNRDVLDNPHLLPIGAELRIPVESEQSAD